MSTQQHGCKILCKQSEMACLILPLLGDPNLVQYALSFLGCQEMCVSQRVCKVWKASACAELRKLTKIDLNLMCRSDLRWPTPGSILRTFNPSMVTTIKIDFDHLSGDQSMRDFWSVKLGLPGHVFQPRVLKCKNGLFRASEVKSWLDLSCLVSLRGRFPRRGESQREWSKVLKYNCPMLKEIDFKLQWFSRLRGIDTLGIDIEMVTILRGCPLLERIGIFIQSSQDGLFTALRTIQTLPHLLRRD